jgi:hypothetical protein
MNKFAKTFDSDKYGQILVVNETDEDGNPEVKFSMRPKNLGICSIGSKFSGNPEGFDKADAFFDAVDIEVAEAVSSQMFDLTKEF